MPDKIDVVLSPDKLQVAPGGSAITTATIKNAGDVVEAYSIEVEGIDRQWCSLSVSSVSLFPGDQEKVQLTIQPPKESASRAGAYDVAVKVTSNRDPTLTTTAQLAVQVGRLLSFDLDLSPKKARGGKGSYKVTIANRGNVATTYTLTGQDPEGVCRFDFGQSAVTVEPGATTEVAMVVNSRKRPFTGKAKTYNFTLTATSHASEAGETKSVQGQFECTPRMPTWALAAAAAVLVIAVVAVLVVVLMGGGGGGPKVNISASPAPPSGCQQVTYTATASSPSGIDRIQIWIDSQMKKECLGSTSCSYTEGPYYLQRELNYEARVWDMDGKEATTGLKFFFISSPCP